MYIAPPASSPILFSGVKKKSAYIGVQPDEETQNSLNPLFSELHV